MDFLSNTYVLVLLVVILLALIGVLLYMRNKRTDE
jgi:LPXTG-motif cell wall-anchored protein